MKDSRADALPLGNGALVDYIAREKSFRGIGPRRAEALAIAFGPDLKAAILRLDVGVIEIIGEASAIAAAAAMEVREAETAFLAWLAEIDAKIPNAKAIRLARAWGPEGVEAARQNPYLLLAVADWRAVDAIARATGVDHDDPRRDVAALEAAVTGDACLGRGSTRVPVTAALRSAERLLGRSTIIGTVDLAIASGAVVRLAKALQPPGAAHMEAECALRLARLASERPVTGVTPAEQLGALLAAYEVAQPFPLTNAQREAVQMAHRHRLMVLAGYAGSGKTTGLRGVCETLEGAGRNPLIVTLSGRAAKRAAEATGRRAITVARFLIDQEGDEQPLDATATLIVDEASMLGLVEVWRILRQIGEASLILCGDPAQLPPISPGIVFHHLAAAPGVARVVLDRVHRQDEASGIPVLAEGVRNGETSDLPPFSGILPGVSFISCTQDALPDELLRLGREIAAGGTRRDDVQIVAPTNATIGDINAFFHRLAMQRDPAVWPFTGHIAEGEPVLWTQNDPERGLTNGALGRVQRITDDEIVVALDGQVHTLDPADGANLQLAYAISVHKAQGSQWQRVIVPVFRSRIVDRSLIYTALTRAQEQVIFLGDEKALWAAVSRPPAAERRDVAFEDWLALARGQADLI